MKPQCPSVQGGGLGFHHEDCTTVDCTWWEKRCTAADTIPLGRLTRKLKCNLAPRCRWALQAEDGLCPPMTHGEKCTHQGGTFVTFDFDEVA